MPSWLETIKLRLPFAKRSPEDQQLIFICCGIAFFFWILVKLSKEYVITQNLQLGYELPLGKAFSALPPTVASAEIKGTGWGLLAAGVPSKQLPLSFPVESGPVFSLTSYDVQTRLATHLGSRVTVNQLSFDNQRIVLEEREQRKIPIRLVADITCAPEHYLAAPLTVQPDSVLVEGPKSKLASLIFLETDSLVLRGVTASAVEKITISAQEEELRFAPVEVSVNIAVEQTTEKSFFVPVELINEPEADSIQIFPNKILVRCIVGLSYYNTISPDDFKVVADLSKAYLKDQRNSVLLQLTAYPDYADNVRITPKAVEFFLVETQETMEAEN